MNASTGGMCLNHPDRPASFQCTVCRGAFCRECASRDHHRMVCSHCLARMATDVPDVRQPWIRKAVAWLPALAGTLILWTLFYCAGRLLLEIPSSFHDGTLWTEGL